METQIDNNQHDTDMNNSNKTTTKRRRKRRSPISNETSTQPSLTNNENTNKTQNQIETNIFIHPDPMWQYQLHDQMNNPNTEVQQTSTSNRCTISKMNNQQNSEEDIEQQQARRESNQQQMTTQNTCVAYVKTYVFIANLVSYLNNGGNVNCEIKRHYVTRILTINFNNNLNVVFLHGKGIHMCADQLSRFKFIHS